MRRQFFVLSVLCAALAVGLAACSSSAQFWRPISEPNLLMQSDTLQKKLAFDLGQCHCGIYPSNVAHDEAVQFQKDKQRLSATSVTVTPGDSNQCMQQPSLVVTECMRHRGWEPTNCAGRVTTPNGGSMCASYTPSED